MPGASTGIASATADMIETIIVPRVTLVLGYYFGHSGKGLAIAKECPPAADIARKHKQFCGASVRRSDFRTRSAFRRAG